MWVPVGIHIKENVSNPIGTKDATEGINIKENVSNPTGTKDTTERINIKENFSNPTGTKDRSDGINTKENVSNPTGSQSDHGGNQVGMYNNELIRVGLTSAPCRYLSASLRPSTIDYEQYQYF